MARAHRPSALEIFINEQTAELRAIKTILQSYLLQTAEPQAVLDLAKNATATLRQHADAQGDPDARRAAEFAVTRAESFFADILPIFARTTATPSGTSH